LATKANTTYVDQQLALKQDTVDWLSKSVQTGRHQIDTGASGLLIKAGNENGIFVQGTSGAAPGQVGVFKDMTVEGDLFVVQNVAAQGHISSGGTRLDFTVASPLQRVVTPFTGELQLVLDKTALADDFAPAFILEEPLIEGFNFATNERSLKIDPLGSMSINSVFASGPITSSGIITSSILCQGNLSIIGGDLIGYNPFWVSGRVSGSNLSIQKSNGKYGFTVSRPAGAEFATGVYKITFNTPAPDANYVISLAQIGSGNIKVWDYNSAFDGRPTTTHFHVVTYNTSWVLTNWNFYFSVFV
jgi:hypothetical protein